MKKSTRFFALCLALTMCATMAMTGALGEAPQPTEEATAVAEVTAAPEATAVPKSPDDILATVNGKNILRSDIQTIYDALASQYAAYGIELSYIESVALEYALQDEYWKQNAAENGFETFTAEEETELQTQAQAEWNSVIDANYTYFLTSTSATPTEQEIADAKAQVEQELANQGYTLEERVKYYREIKIQERIIDLLMKDVPAFTDEEIQAEYQKRVAEDTEAFDASIINYESAISAGESDVWYVPEGVRGITHILLSVDSEILNKYLDAKAQLESQQSQEQALAEEDIDPNPDTESATVDPASTPTTEPAATPEPTLDPAATPTPAPVTQADVDAARQAVLDSIKDKTDDIYKRLEAGETFASLVEQYGEDPGMQEEPYKTEGYTVHKDFENFIPEFVQGAFAPELQKVGDYGQPVIGSYGVHILNYTRDIPSGPKELTEESKALLLSEMDQIRKNEIVGKAVEDWFASSEITYTGLVPKLED